MKGPAMDNATTSSKLPDAEEENMLEFTSRQRFRTPRKNNDPILANASAVSERL